MLADDRSIESGPSPRARGSLALLLQDDALAGSIPACAGEPCRSRSWLCPPRVHPRVRGGAVGYAAGDSSVYGPSPRARGSRQRPVHPVPGPGSIPACAGEPCRARRGGRPAAVHPRVRGGACRLPAGLITVTGPSPRARGSRRLDHGAAAGPRSIPACAGEPPSSAPSSAPSSVHPRVRGGAHEHGAPVLPGWGPSPRARGSPSPPSSPPASFGSIPACAGEPGRPGHHGTRGAVHPRVRGGAAPPPEI